MKIDYKGMIRDYAVKKATALVKDRIKDRIKDLGRDSVVIAGAGIAGSFLAGRLAGQGIRVTVLEKAPAHFLEPDWSEPVSIKTLSQAGLPAYDGSVNIKRSRDDIRLYEPVRPHRAFIRLKGSLFELPMDVVLIDRRALLRYLREKAVAAGAQIHYGISAVGMAENIVMAHDRHGNMFQFACNMAIDATGPDGRLRCSDEMNPLFARPLDSAAFSYVRRVLVASPANGTDIHARIAPYRQWLTPYGPYMTEKGLLTASSESAKAPWQPLINGQSGRQMSQRVYCGMPLVMPAVGRMLAVGSAAGQTDALTGVTIGPALRASMLAEDTVRKALERHDFSMAGTWGYGHSFFVTSRLGARQSAISYLAGQMSKITVEQLSDWHEQDLMSERFLASLTDPYADFDYDGLLEKVVLSSSGMQFVGVLRKMEKIYRMAMAYPELSDKEGLDTWYREMKGLR